eukprot:TRINITY_DN40621_c0_g1_i1.p1 TRINITY_DN40621_c0_g1~~TRINITY_DN40621_c0_g1_i1.p1  ORF type:complete len:1282 (+),score=256.96 TRINITY_DN40621_c0_g1_i1:54-3899(+)
MNATRGLPDLPRRALSPAAVGGGGATPVLPPVPRNPNISTCQPEQLDLPSNIKSHHSEAGTGASSIFRFVPWLDDENTPRQMPSKPATPLSVQSFSESRAPSAASARRAKEQINAAAAAERKIAALEPAQPTQGNATALRIRSEIEQLRNEMEALQELEEREKEALKQEERKHEEDRQRRHREKEERRQVEEQEMRKYHEQARAERRQRELQDQDRKEKAKKEQEQDRQRVLWEYQNLLNGSGAEAERTRTKRDQLHEHESRMDAGRKEQMKVQKSLREEIRKMYAELEELQDPCRATTGLGAPIATSAGVPRTNIGALQVMRAIPHLEAHYNEAKRAESKSELDSMRDEIRALERADHLATERRKAKEDHDRMLREKEQEELMRRLEEQRRILQERGQVLSQQEEERAQKAVRELEEAESEKSRTRRSTAPEGPLAGVVRPSGRAAIQIDRPSDPIHLQNKIAQPTQFHRRWMSEEEYRELERQDIAAQRQRQLQDLEKIRREHEQLLQEEEAASASKHTGSDLDRQLEQELLELKSKIASRTSGQPLEHPYLPQQYQRLHSPAKPLSVTPQLHCVSESGKKTPPGVLATPQRALQSRHVEHLQKMQEIDNSITAARVTVDSLFAQQEEDKWKRHKEHLAREEANRQTRVGREKQHLTEVRQKHQEELSLLRARLRELEEAPLPPLSVAPRPQSAPKSYALIQTDDLEEKATNLEKDYTKALGNDDTFLSAIESSRIERQMEMARWSVKLAEPAKEEKLTAPMAQEVRPKPSEKDSAEERDAAARRIQGLYHFRQAKQDIARRRQTRSAKNERQFSVDSAVLIQATFRRHLGRVRFLKIQEEKKKRSSLEKEVEAIWLREQEDELRRRQQEELCLLEKWNVEAEARLITSPLPILSVAKQNSEVDIQSEQGAKLEQSIGVLQRSMEESLSSKAELDRREEELFGLRVEREKQRLQLDRLHTLLEEHASIINQLLQLQGPAPLSQVPVPPIGPQSVDTSPRPQRVDCGRTPARKNDALLEQRELAEERRRQQREIERMNELLDSHSAIISQLVLQSNSLSSPEKAGPEGPPVVIQKATLEDSEVTAARRSQAAVTLQRVFRGWWQRKQLTALRAALQEGTTSQVRQEAAEMIQCFWRRHRAKQAVAQRRAELTAARNIQHFYRNHTLSQQTACTATTAPKDEIAARDAAAAKIQGFYRKAAAPPPAQRGPAPLRHQEVYRRIVQEEAALLVQKQWRGVQSRKRVIALRNERMHQMESSKKDEAAVRIQSVYRGWSARRRSG